MRRIDVIKKRRALAASPHNEALELSGMSWAELKSLAKGMGLSIRRKNRKQIEAEISGGN
ncbi:MAG: hypothetical protein KBT88_03480 [Gammaproteobacteria bacterium]|nr:hypothetical protein [Gammaproteobacteria bacterium]MBQ0838822.1 hypothetical protein [Gammaproteobacteria bacterium]